VASSSNVINYFVQIGQSFYFAGAVHSATVAANVTSYTIPAGVLSPNLTYY
jgi:hypothetical protein